MAAMRGSSAASERGDGAAARAAHGADAGGVDLRAGAEVVDGADGVPEHVLVRRSRRSGWAGGRPRRVRRWALREGFAGVRGVRVLQALALADGVVGEDGEAVAREGSGGGVVARFAGGAVARSHQDCGQLACRFAIGI